MNSKNKIDPDFTQYVILGACNPGLVFRVLSKEIDIGLFLPCNVVVYEDPEKGETILGFIDPEMMVKATGRTELDILQKMYEKNYKLHLIQFKLK